MAVAQQILAFCVLSAWVLSWWLAVRIVFGSRFGVLEWIPVAFASFGVPLCLADWAAVNRGLVSAEWLGAAWGGVAIAIDFTWASWRFCRQGND